MGRSFAHLRQPCVFGQPLAQLLQREHGEALVGHLTLIRHFALIFLKIVIFLCHYFMAILNPSRTNSKHFWISSSSFILYAQIPNVLSRFKKLKNFKIISSFIIHFLWMKIINCEKVKFFSINLQTHYFF
jgi:hypothetical protein